MAQRKGSLVGLMKAADDQVKAEAQADAGPIRPGGEMVTTAVHIPKATLSLLRRVAVARADKHGGRPSVSGVLVDLVERARTELEREAGR
jgi:hypothetical protein